MNTLTHKIGILSDTHNLLRPEVTGALSGCELIFHGGDISKQDILDQLSEIAPVHVVRGNNDKAWAEYIPETLMENIFGLNIFMVHNKKFIPKDLDQVDLVIYGHSHKYEEKVMDGVQYLNPGSCGPRRFNQDITMAILYIEEGSDQETAHKPAFRIEKILIPHPDKNAGQSAEKIPSDIAATIPAIMKEIDAGKTVKQIARKHHLSEELTEQITRMYLTHPGVDVDGILKRIGL